MHGNNDNYRISMPVPFIGEWTGERVNWVRGAVNITGAKQIIILFIREFQNISNSPQE
jgi:hypothetical protein